MSECKQEIKQEVKEEVMAWQINYSDDNIIVDPLEVEVLTPEQFEKLVPKKDKTKHYTPQCRTCSKTFLKDQDLNEHYQNNESHKPKRYMCTLCHKTYDFQHELRLHKSSIHRERLNQELDNQLQEKPKLYKCNLCDKEYLQRGALENHTNYRHTGIKPFLCEHCGTCFVTKYSLVCHIENIHTDKKSNDKLKDRNPSDLECVFCYQLFPGQSLLDRHLKIHRGLKKNECTLCGRTFGNTVSKKIHKCRSSSSRLVSEPMFEEYTDQEVANYTDDEFRKKFRMSRQTFSRVLLLIQDKVDAKSCRPEGTFIPSDVQLQLVLWYFGTTDVFRTMYEHYKMAQPTARRCLRRVTQALVDLAPSIITWPCGEFLEEVKKGFGEMGLRNTIGSIGVTHIDAHSKPKVNTYYVSKQDYPSITFQAVCDHTLKFTNIYVKDLGHMSDAEVLMQSDVWTFMNKQRHLMFPDDTHLVGNASYPCLPELMTPFDGTLTDKQAEFNRLLSVSRNAINRSFELLESRFRCLKALLDVRSKCSEWVPKYIIACCVLHNICVMRNDLVEVDKVHDAGDDNVKPDFKDVDRARLDLGIQKRNEMCQGL